MKGAPGYMKRLAAWIESHGNRVLKVTTEGVTFQLPWYDPTTGEDGADVVTVDSFTSARVEMGY